MTTSEKQPKVSYQQRYRKCGKAGCRVCAGGQGHGPYWYGYWREGGKVHSRYFGTHLPADALAKAEETTGHPSPDTRSPDSRQLSATLMGKFELTINGKVLPAELWRKHKAALLIKSILLAPDMRLSRQKAVDWLWAEFDGDSAMNNLRVTLHHLRRSTAPYLAKETPLLVNNENGIAIAPNIEVKLDIIEFEQAAQHALSNNLEGAEAALNLYTADLLPEDLDQSWIEERREKVRRLWLELAHQLVRRYRANGKLRHTEHLLSHILERDPYDERALGELMRLLGATGRRAEGLRLYRLFTERLRRDVGVSPENTSRAAYEHLLKAESMALPPLPPARERNRSNLTRHERAGAVLGREAELNLAAKLIATALQGQSRLLLLGGEVGIGKTRLAEEIASRASAAGMEVAWGRCYEQASRLPYLPFVEAARQLLETLPANYLKNALAHQAAWLLPLLPELASKISGLTPPEAAPPDKEQARQREALMLLLEAACLRAPLVLVLEDWHWADGETIAFLHYFARRSAEQNLPLLMLCTYRSDETDKSIRDMSTESITLVREELASKIQLGGLSKPEAEALINRIIQTPLTPAMQEMIYQQTEGNPFFIEELAKLIKEKAGEVANIEQLALPDTVRETIGRRLSHLSEVTLRLLRAAAVLGSEFEPERLQKVAGLEDEELLDALDEAVAAQLLIELEADETKIEILRFKHVLIRKYLYDSLSHLRRTKLHARAGAILEEEVQTGHPINPAEIAAHYQEGHDYDKAVHLYTEAGRKAAALSANATAIDYFRRALALLEAGSKEPQKIAQQVEIGLQWVGSACFIESLSENQARLQQLEKLVTQKLGSYDGRDTLLAEVYYWFGRVYFVSGYIDSAIYYCEKSLELAQENSLLAAQALSALGRAMALRGDSDRAKELLERAGPQLEALGDLFEASYCYGILGHVTFQRGDPENSMRFCDRSLALAQQSGNPSRIGAAYYYRCIPLVEGNNWEEGLESAQKCLEIGLSLGENYYAGLAEVYIGYALFKGGKPQEAVEHLKTSLELTSGVGQYLVSARARSYLAEIYLATGEFDLAQQEAEQVLKETETGINWGAGTALRVLGEIWQRRNPPDYLQAEQYLRMAIDTQERLGSPAGVTRARQLLENLRELETTR